MNFSFVVPIYNDGYLVDAFCAEFLEVFRSYLGKLDIAGEVELILVNDGSRNDSLDLLKQAAARYGFVKVIDLSRNFGQHVAMICGYHHAIGKYVGRLNVDMQDPPSEIPQLLEIIKRGDCDIVIGVQRDRQSSLLDRVTSWFFVWFFNFLIGGKVPHSTASLRVMTRQYADNYKRINDKAPFLQGLETWFGYRVKYVPTDHQQRPDKNSSYTFMKRLKLALNASIAFSDRPLKYVVYLGMIIGLVGFAGLLLIVLRQLFVADLLQGYSSTVAIVLFCSGVQILVIGLSGLYIGKILSQVQGRPLYLVREKINFDGSPSCPIDS
jgi:glycosyltransferase involved in cell wall biosynthesis